MIQPWRFAESKRNAWRHEGQEDQEPKRVH